MSAESSAAGEAKLAPSELEQIAALAGSLPTERGEIVKKFRVHPTDSGSPEVQIALLTGRLGELVTHFAKHTQDIHSKRGMYRMISQRKKLLQYLKNESPERYKNVISSLGLRK